MEFYDEIKKLEQEVFEEWFKNWTQKADLKNSIREFVQQGYNSLSIDFPRGEDRYGAELVMREDPLLLEELEEYLGRDFDISYFNSVVSKSVSIRW